VHVDEELDSGTDGNERGKPFKAACAKPYSCHGLMWYSGSKEKLPRKKAWPFSTILKLPILPPVA